MEFPLALPSRPPEKLKKVKLSQYRGPANYDVFHDLSSSARIGGKGIKKRFRMDCIATCAMVGYGSIFVAGGVLLGSTIVVRSMWRRQKELEREHQECQPHTIPTEKRPHPWPAYRQSQAR